MGKLLPTILPDENSSGGVKSCSYIPEGLREEILVRLPVKSVLRFKSVCKTWRSMFHSRPFVDFYCQRHSCDYSVRDLKKTLKADLIKIAPALSELPLPSMETKTEEWNRMICVFGPLSNGIYCLTSHLLHNSGRVGILTGKIALCNPATRDYKFTNPFPPDTHSLLTDLASTPCRLHFGFGSVPKPTSLGDLDYKVVVIINSDAPLSSFVCFVYILQSGKWKKIVDYERGKSGVDGDHNKVFTNIHGRVEYPRITPEYELCPQRFFNGCWHWMARFDHGHANYSSVLSFNFVDETFKLIGGPQCYIDYHPVEAVSMNGMVLVLNDHLAAIYLFHTSQSPTRCVDVDVWMMTEYGVEQSWTRIYKIKPNFCGVFSRLLGILTPYLRDEERDGNCITGMIFQYSDMQMVVVPDDWCTEPRVCDTSSFIHWNNVGISTYMETLEPL